MADEHAAFGGPGWSPRTATLADELGAVWARCGLRSEWAPLRQVLLHRPGPELAAAAADPNAVQMLAPLDPGRAAAQHDALAAVYRAEGVAVHLVAPPPPPPPNLMFAADLLFMTPEGAILARPASTVRAGEERLVAARLASLGVPILRSVRGAGHFEGADACWLDPETVLLARGLRTDREGAAQVAATLGELGIAVVQVDLEPGAMHLMGVLRRLDHDLALAWPGRVPQAALAALAARGVTVLDGPDPDEARTGFALNLVTLGPRRVLMPAGNPRTRAALERSGVDCREVAVDELAKAAGAIGCLTGVLERAG